MRLQAVSASHYRKRDHKTQSKVNTAASERRRRHNGTNSVSTPPGRKHIKPLEPVAFVILVSAPEPRGLPVSMVSWTVKVPFALRRVCALLNVQVALCANGPRQNAKLRPIIEEMCGEWEELPASTFAAAGRTSAPCCSRQPSHIEEPRTMKSGPSWVIGRAILAVSPRTPLPCSRSRFLAVLSDPALLVRYTPEANCRSPLTWQERMAE